MELEQTNTVGEPAEKIQLHVFACHERIHALKAELKAARNAMADAYQKAAKIDHEFSRLRIAVDSLACDLNPREDEDLANTKVTHDPLGGRCV